MQGGSWAQQGHSHHRGALPTGDMRDPSARHWPPGTGTVLTLHIAHAVLADHPSVILLVCRPLVDEHGCVGGPGVQHDAILQGGGSGSGPGAGRPPAAPGYPEGRHWGSTTHGGWPVLPWQRPAQQLQEHCLAEASAAQPSMGMALPTPACMGLGAGALPRQGYWLPQDAAWHSTGTLAFWAWGPP